MLRSPCSPPVGSSSHRRRTLLPERSKLFKSHWLNQWLTSEIELQIHIFKNSYFHKFKIPNL